MFLQIVSILIAVNSRRPISLELRPPVAERLERDALTLIASTSGSDRACRMPWRVLAAWPRMCEAVASPTAAACVIRPIPREHRFCGATRAAELDHAGAGIGTAWGFGRARLQAAGPAGYNRRGGKFARVQTSDSLLFGAGGGFSF